MRVLWCFVFFLFVLVESLPTTGHKQKAQGNSKMGKMSGNDDCMNSFMTSLESNTFSMHELPSSRLLITSADGNVENIFKELLQDEKSSHVISSCGNFTYSSFINVITFTLNEDTTAANLRHLVQLLNDRHICIEFDDVVGSP